LKRTVFVAGALFLELNGLRFTASEESVVETFLALASGTMAEADLAASFREHSEPATHAW
jgi:prophage maintenance system killer protein